MSPEAQRIAIAELRGWVRIIEKRGHLWQGERADGSVGLIPDYLNDLNAIREAEKVLTEEQLPEYGHQLAKLTVNMLPNAWWDQTADEVAKIAHASAAKRAEALLRTLGLWEETN